MLPEGLSLHPSSRVRRRSGRTALHVAATHGRLLETQHLLEAGADVHASDNDGPERVGFFKKVLQWRVGYSVITPKSSENTLLD